MLVFELSGIRKAFGAVWALQWNPEHSVEISTGEVWAFAGENGAGKSTLAAILAGVTLPDEGTLRFRGEPYFPSSVNDASARGVQIIFQEPALIPSLTVAENLFLGREREFSVLGLRRRGRMNAAAKRLLAQICPHVDPRETAGDLSLEDQKLVETARAVSTDPRCIIFDETTAAMSSRNTTLLINLIARLKPTTAVIIVTHRTEEIFSVTDRILVLKDSRFVRTLTTSETNPDELSNLMVGREIDLHLRNSAATRADAESLLSITDLTITAGIRDVSLTLNRGRIIGIGGLAGAGQEGILRALYGLERTSGGYIVVKGESYTERSPRRSIRNGIVYSPKNRDREGLILHEPVRDNIVLSILNRLSAFGLSRRSKQSAVAAKLAARLRIKFQSIMAPCRSLSGGNRQKVVLAKLLATEADIFLLDNPTRGIDIGARAEIYQLMNELTARGAGILMVSDELQELLQMSDSILLVRAGQVSKRFERAEQPQEADLIQHMI